MSEFWAYLLFWSIGVTVFVTTVSVATLKIVSAIDNLNETLQKPNSYKEYEWHLTNLR